VLLGAFTKSAQAPFHFWLPNAMAAPTPVSAYLHSATMVKAGVFFLARFWPVLGGTPEWTLLLTVIGGLTALTGGVMAFGAEDLKKILAYSTISALGLMVLTFGVGTQTAIYAGISLIIAHGLYKSSLFMLAGIIDKGSGTRSLQQLPGRLYERMPLAFWLVLAASLSLGGILPFFGFVAKELLVETALSAPSRKLLLTGVVVLTGALFVAVLLMLTHQTFFQQRDASSDRPVKKLNFAYYLPPLISALGGLLFGLFPGVLSGLFSLSAQSLDPALPAKSLSLWHGWNTALMLSLLSVAVGAGLYYGRRPLKALWPAGALRNFGPSRGYDRLVDGMLKAAAWHTRVIQNGQLRYYIMATMFSLLLLTSFTFFYKEGVKVESLAPDVLIFEVVLLGIMLMALTFILTVRYRIDSLLGLGIVGIVISIVFLEGGAPDLAITFFLIDTLTIILFVLILHRLPKRVAPKGRIAAARDLLIAAGMGLMVTFLLLAVTDGPLDSKLKHFYAGNSYAMAKGRNIVNVILVDFRSLDTFGEIIVLAIAAFGVYAIVTFPNQKNNA
jgi:multicomponent Na+:H+ antiporter subunit A